MSRKSTALKASFIFLSLQFWSLVWLRQVIPLKHRERQAFSWGASVKIQAVKSHCQSPKGESCSFCLSLFTTDFFRIL